MRILIAEDEASLRLTLAANIELAGYEVVEAANGAEAIAALAREQIDVVLSDVRMPNMGGVDLLMHIKQAYPSLPVVLMTAYSAEAQIQTAILSGAFTVLKKPFDVDKVIELLLHAARGPAVLVVAAEGPDAHDLASNLRAAGLKAELASSAQQALDLVRTGGIDVCLADLRAIEMNAAALVAELSKSVPRVSLIVVGATDALALAEPGAIAAYLRKPVSRQEALHSVSRARGGAW